MSLQTLEVPSGMVPAKEAARITARSVQTLRRMVAAGEVEAYKLRRNVFFKRSDLDALFKPIAKQGGAR